MFKYFVFIFSVLKFGRSTGKVFEIDTSIAIDGLATSDLDAKYAWLRNTSWTKTPSILIVQAPNIDKDQESSSMVLAGIRKKPGVRPDGSDFKTHKKSNDIKYNAN